MLPVLALGVCAIHYGVQQICKNFKISLSSFLLIHANTSQQRQLFSAQSHPAPEIMKVFSVPTVSLKHCVLIRLTSLIGLWFWLHRLRCGYIPCLLEARHFSKDVKHRIRVYWINGSYVSRHTKLDDSLGPLATAQRWSARGRCLHHHF